MAAGDTAKKAPSAVRTTTPKPAGAGKGPTSRASKATTPVKKAAARLTTPAPARSVKKAVEKADVAAEKARTAGEKVTTEAEPTRAPVKKAAEKAAKVTEPAKAAVQEAVDKTSDVAEPAREAVRSAAQGLAHGASQVAEPVKQAAAAVQATHLARDGRVEEAKEVAASAQLGDGMAQRAIADVDGMRYQVEVNKRRVSVTALTDTLNERWANGWRLAHVIEQRGNLMLFYEKRD